MYVQSISIFIVVIMARQSIRRLVSTRTLHLQQANSILRLLLLILRNKRI